MARKTSQGTKAAAQADWAPNHTCTALYIRVSTLKQADEGFSLAAQRKELDEYCTRQGWPVVTEHIYIDAGVSGKTDERPAFQAMLAAAQAGQLQRIVATKLDRIARNLKNLLQTVDELKQSGCALVIKKEAFDTSTPQGMFVLQMLGAVSELERSMIHERVQSGRVENASGGGYNGARCPLGYTYRAGVFVINEVEAATVRRIFSLFLAGQSLNAIARAMHDAGAQTAAGGRWYPATVGYILRNGQYAGLAQWDGVEVGGIYPAIINKATYEAADKRLQALRPGIQLESEIARRLQAAA